MTVAESLQRGGGLAVLVDPGRITVKRAGRLASRAAADGVRALLLGTSFGGEAELRPVARALRDGAPELPLLLFPATAAQLVPEVSAILLLSLVSGRNAQYLIDEHVRAVPFFLRYPEVETISTAYCLIDGGRITSVEAVSQTRPLPADKPELVEAHVHAAMRIGMRAVYLEAGSGASRAVAPALVRAARGATAGPLFVGGGIRGPDDVRRAREAGADLVVVGTAVERGGGEGLVRELAAAATA